MATARLIALKTLLGVLVALAAFGAVVDAGMIIYTKMLLAEPEPIVKGMALLCRQGGGISLNVHSSEIHFAGGEEFKIWNDELKGYATYVKNNVETCMIVPTRIADALEERQEEAQRPKYQETYIPESLPIWV